MVKLPSDVDINNLIDDIKNFSWEASEILLNYSHLIKNSSYKNNILKTINIEDPVTKADLEVNEIIIKRINEKYKNIDWDILSEENVKIKSNISNKNSRFLWVLDPLDGTKDFLQSTDNYAMHLALNYKQKPYIGFVLIPERNELWISNNKQSWGERKDGSYLKTNLSKNKTLNNMTIVTSKNHRNQALEKLLAEVKFKKRIIMGSIGCKIASIVRGESDIYISLSMPGESSPKDWDFAAPASILISAGGSITNIDNKELIYNQNKFEQNGIIVASNSKQNHATICSQIKNIIKKNNIYPF